MLKKRICHISNYTIIDSYQWDVFDSSMTFRLKISIIDTNILLLKASGYAARVSQQEIWPKMKNIITTQMENQKFFLVHDYTDLKSASPWSRYDYTHWVIENADNFYGMYFFGASSLMKIMIQTGVLLSSKLDNSYIFPDYKAAILDISTKKLIAEEKQENIIFLKSKKDIPPEEMKKGKIIVSASGIKYIVRQQWEHRNNEYIVKTFFLGNNVFFRYFHGSFVEDDFADLGKSFEEIINDSIGPDEKFHFYVDFTHAQIMSLSFRKDASLWYEKMRGRFVSVGFFHLSPVNKMAIIIARNLVRYSGLKQKIFVLSLAVEAFEKIENIEDLDVQNNDKVLSKMSKKDLIRKVHRLNRDHEEVINDLYSKIGRISWDVNFDLEEIEVDTDGKYSDIYNAIRLVQQDVRDLLKKSNETNVNTKKSDSDSLEA